MSIKKFFKRNTRNIVLKNLSRFGLALNRLYENKNYDIQTNGELNVLEKLELVGPKVIFDVGANKGDYASLASKVHPEAVIFAFEPVEQTFGSLKKSTTSLANIEVFQKGLSSSDGKKDIYLFGDDVHSSMVPIAGMGRMVRDKHEVEVVSGDSFMENADIKEIDLLKIDVEGAEMDVIQGFRSAFDNQRIIACQFEYGYANITSHNLLIDFYQFFSKRGYLVGKIYPKSVKFSEYNVKQEDFLGPNFLAVRETEKELLKALSKQSI